MSNSIRTAFSRRRILRNLTGAAGLMAFGSVLMPVGARTAAAALTETDRADLARVERYLNGIGTLRARFNQVAEDGSVAYGTIYLRRPGQMRVEYEPPVPVLLVADGTLVSYYDSELDQLSQVPLRSTPAWFLLRDPIDLTDDITVTDVERGPGVLRVDMYQSDNREAGSVELVFSEDPLELRQWTITDARGRDVHITLENVSYGAPLANALFATPRTRRQGGRF
jgi:outer membrane lipoprotein-sorting protein